MNPVSELIKSIDHPADGRLVHSASIDWTSTDAGAALREAIAQDQWQLLYQPLADLRTGAISSLEALLHWRHPVHGLLQANQFRDLIERAGMRAVAGQWVLDRACGDLCHWRAQNAERLTVAVKVAASQLGDPDFGAVVADTLARAGLAPDALSLEITEAALTEAGPACDSLLAGFRMHGLCLTLDDFGTGDASLSNLKRYRFDALKIDAHFIFDVVTNTDDAAMCRTLIAMAHHFGMQVVAKGVETEGQCDFLRRNMCDHIQGYFFAQPLAREQVDQLLEEQRALPPHLLRLHKPARRILLVDDEPNIVAALKRLLRGDQYQIFTANSGQQGLELLAQQAVDVIVSDQRMPGMLGADFLRKAKQLSPETIRIMLSGYTELQSVTDAVNEGAIYKFLTKPWDDEQLRGHIAEAFRVKEIADDNQRLHMEVRSANQELATANRNMKQLLLEKQRQISRDEISLSVAHELLEHLPLPVIGMDDAGVIAFINGAAEILFGRAGALLGSEAAQVLPQLLPSLQDGGAGQSQHRIDIDGQGYNVVLYPMGENSASRGTLITLSHSRETP